MMVKILITIVIVLFMIVIIDWMIDRIKSYRKYYYPSKDLSGATVIIPGEQIITKEQRERKMKLDKRDKLAKKFMIIAGLRDHWKGLYVRKYTEHIVNIKGLSANKIPCYKGRTPILNRKTKMFTGWDVGCGKGCPIVEYFRTEDCSKLNEMILANPPKGQALAGEVLDEIEMYLKDKYADIIKPERERDNLDKIFEGLEVDWDKEDA